ncbi:hypothetical protein CEXT_203771 [Caerostris extrusa]|uniref:Uncharacterized protein n=1 Tax=Caerostris extrusa TaxID=172846 RepID=A0AAV4PJU5_CAEEX|nr:hypothetical protein CEXT_203771 [Caerostris extrusa]
MPFHFRIHPPHHGFKYSTLHLKSYANLQRVDALNPGEHPPRLRLNFKLHIFFSTISFSPPGILASSSSAIHISLSPQNILLAEEESVGSL